MMSTKGLILMRYMAENSKNVNTSQNKPSIFMIFPERIANQHREAVLKFQDNSICNSCFILAYHSFFHRKPNNDSLMGCHNFVFFSKLEKLNCRETPSPIPEFFCV